MRPLFRAALAAAAVIALCSLASVALAATADTTVVNDPAKFGILVSATKTPKSAIDVPNGAVIIKGEDLRRMGVHTLGEALEDVVGVEAGGGTDNGTRMTNIGMWGLKEFDALLITVDGVPVGGPFNPELSHIDIDDIDHIEIVKGPQGTMYGLAAFAGMVQVFTNSSQPGMRNLTIGGGSFSNFDGSLNAGQKFNEDWRGDLHVTGHSGDGWQDRTKSSVFGGRGTLSGHYGKAKLAFDVSYLSDHSDWATPMPVEDGTPVAEFGAEGKEANFAVGGATVNHDVFGLGMRATVPLMTGVRFENIFNFTNDSQKLIRNFFNPDETAGDFTHAFFDGLEISPKQSTFFDDARVVHDFEAGGHHESVVGVAITHGELKAKGIGKDITDIDVSQGGANMPDWNSLPEADAPEFEDGRTFFGAYAHDEWTPQYHLTIGGGGRYDNASEELETEVDNGGGEEKVKSTKTSSAWSGDISALVRLLPAGGPHIVNVYGNWKSSFKPAAPNLTEGEDTEILDPERTHSVEGGVKGSFFNGQLGLDAAMFQLDFTNLVVAVDNGGTPGLANAGRERFKGTEVSVRIAPATLPGFSLSGGWASHDPRFVDFIDDGTQIGGNLVELAPRQLWNVRAAYAPAKFLGAWVSAHHEGRRVMDRQGQDDPANYSPAFDEVSAGVTFLYDKTMVQVAGRNLGDEKYFVSESDIGDSQFYYAPPRRYTASVTYRW